MNTNERSLEKRMMPNSMHYQLNQQRIDEMRQQAEQYRLAREATRHNQPEPIQGTVEDAVRNETLTNREPATRREVAHPLYFNTAR
jgi:hypothetical protein